MIGLLLLKQAGRCYYPARVVDDVDCPLCDDCTLPDKANCKAAKHKRKPRKKNRNRKHRPDDRAIIQSAKLVD